MRNKIFPKIILSALLKKKDLHSETLKFLKVEIAARNTKVILLSTSLVNFRSQANFPN